MSLESHWQEIYKDKDIETLGWYQKDPEPSLSLIERVHDPSDTIIDVGCGATTLIDHLLQRGYKDIIGVDISQNALNKIENRISGLKDDNQSLKLITKDLTNPNSLQDINADIWHDRAVLHFFTEDEDRESYKTNIKSVLKPGGFAIISAFNLNSAEKCSGLPVHRYSAEMLDEFLGEDFVLIHQEDYLYNMPSGDTRPYIYTIFQYVKN